MNGNPSADRRQGEVVGINATNPPTVQITIGGDSSNQYPARYADWYRPVIGDSIMVLSNQGTHWVLGTSYGPPARVFVNVPSPSLATTSASFVSIGSSGGPSFTKRRDASVLEVTIHASAFVTVTGTIGEFGIALTGAGVTDYAICDPLFQVVNARVPFSGTMDLTGVLAGDYVPTIRARVTTGTGTLTLNANDYLQYRIREVL